MFFLIFTVSIAALIIFYQSNEKTESGDNTYSTGSVYSYFNKLFDDYESYIEEYGEQDKLQDEKESSEKAVVYSKARTYALMRLKRVKDMAQWEIIKQEDYAEYQANEYERKIAGIKKQYPEIYEYYERLRNEEPQVLERYVEEADEIELAVKMFSESVEYADNYIPMIEQSIKQGNSMLLSPVYSERNTFGHMNIVKSKYDYRKLLNVKVSPDNNKAVEAVIESSSYVNIMILIIVFICIFRFFEERKNGLWHIVNMGAEGRYRLGIVRAAVLFAVCLITTLAVYGVLCAAAFLMYGGADDMNGAIQNSAVYGTVRLLVTKWEFLMLFLLVTVLGIFMTGLVMWVIMSAIHNNSIGIAAAFAVLICSYMMYAYIPEKSVFNFLKYINIWCAVYTGEIFCRYHNWGYGAFITDTMESTALFIAAIIPVCILAAVLINGKKKPIGKASLAAKIMDKLSVTVGIGLEKLPCFFKEMYKLLISQRSIIALAVLVFIAMDNRVERGYVFDADMVVAMNYYDEAKGLGPGRELDNIVKRYEQEFEALKAEQEVIKESIAKGEDTYGSDELQNIKQKCSLYEKGISEIHRNISNIQELSAKGINVTVQPPFVTEEVLGEELFHNQRLYGILAMFGVVMLSFGFFSYEKKNNMTVLVHSSRNGRIKWFVRKVLAIDLCVTVLWALLSVINWTNILKIYNLEDLDVLIQSYPVMAEFPFTVTTGCYFLIIYLWKLVMMLSVSWIVMLLSVLLDYSKSLIAAVTLLVPHFLLELGMTYFYALSVVMPLCQTENWLTIRGNAYGYLYGLIIFTAGILCICWAAKKIVSRKPTTSISHN